MHATLGNALWWLAWLVVIFLGGVFFLHWASRLLLEKVMQQISDNSKQFIGSLYAQTNAPAPFWFWRKHLKQKEAEVRAAGFIPFLNYRNETLFRHGKKNHYAVYRSTDKTIALEISFLLMERTMPFLGLQMPFPDWTGNRNESMSMLTVCASGLHITSSRTTEANDNLPDTFAAHGFPVTFSLSEWEAAHRAVVEVQIKAGDQAVPMETAEQFMEDAHLQNHLLSPGMAEHTARNIRQIYESIGEEEP